MTIDRIFRNNHPTASRRTRMAPPSNDCCNKPDWKSKSVERCPRRSNGFEVIAQLARVDLRRDNLWSAARGLPNPGRSIRACHISMENVTRRTGQIRVLACYVVVGSASRGSCITAGDYLFRCRTDHWDQGVLSSALSCCQLNKVDSAWVVGGCTEMWRWRPCWYSSPHSRIALIGRNLVSPLISVLTSAVKVEATKTIGSSAGLQHLPLS